VAHDLEISDPRAFDEHFFNGLLKQGLCRPPLVLAAIAKIVKTRIE
jgi:hypothetical protein